MNQWLIIAAMMAAFTAVALLIQINDKLHRIQTILENSKRLNSN